ncbi:class I SAM-dependent methyltransferase [Cerasicoccus maritimus]|uniref:class I SAM-dependent methyltransferase n=1 Tax=Cerasicoccus maritimus TaxID=490089 RepID=UPI0028527211|nr:class I SAM-dependent methyltransferase [Cerasicoccus maritimus]
MPINENYQPAIERFTGFEKTYDNARPSPPDELANMLCSICRSPVPELVVDLGCGTGLSTRYWSDRASCVIGVEPTESMRRQAEAACQDSKLRYLDRFAHDTGLVGESADIVVAVQAMHWLEPVSTLAEVARILRPGGVFAVVDYSWPPTTPFWEVDLAYLKCHQKSSRLEQLYGVSSRLMRWNKDGHLQRIRESGLFRFSKECHLHHVELGGAERIVNLLRSQGHIQSLLKYGLSESDLGILELSSVANSAFGNDVLPWHWSAQVYWGVK